MVSGGIHEEILFSEDRTIVQQVLDLEGLLISAIKLLKREFGRVFLPCVVGNHGRSTLCPPDGHGYDGYHPGEHYVC
jgi:hypothetical protein